MMQEDFSDSIIAETIDIDTLPAELLEELDFQISCFDESIEVVTTDYWGNSSFTPI